MSSGDPLAKLRALRSQASTLTESTASAESVVDDPEFSAVLSEVQVALGGSFSEGAVLAFEPAVELLRREPPKTLWVIKSLLPKLALAAIAGEPKTTKTWTAIELAMSVATGTKAMGAYEPGDGARPVALLLAEDGQENVRNRLRALAAGRGLDPQTAVARIHVICRRSLDLRDDAALTRLVIALRRIPDLALVALDPLRDLHRGEENDSGAMSDVMHRLRAIRDLVGVSVIFVHHSAKAGLETNGRRAGQRMRGSSTVHGAVDGGIYLHDLRTDDGGRWENTVTIELKAARAPAPFRLCLEVQDDEDGACCARWSILEKVPQGGEEVLEDILRVLRASTVPLSEDAIRQRVGKKRDTVRAMLHKGRNAGLVEQASNGARVLGWRIAGAASTPQHAPARPGRTPGGTPATTPDHAPARPGSEPLGGQQYARPPLGGGAGWPGRGGEVVDAPGERGVVAQEPGE
jgi:hypothetical protein